MSTVTLAAMMMKKEKKAISANSFEIDLIEEAGILVTVKAKQPNPKLATGGGESSVGVEEEEEGRPNSRIIRLTNVVKEYDLRSDEKYDRLLYDLRDECLRFGRLVNVVIPRPNRDLTPPPGVGKAFLEYVKSDGASRARSFLNGKYWSGNLIVAEYFPENMYAVGLFDGA